MRREGLYIINHNAPFLVPNYTLSRGRGALHDTLSTMQGGEVMSAPKLEEIREVLDWLNAEIMTIDAGTNYFCRMTDKTESLIKRLAEMVPCEMCRGQGTVCAFCKTPFDFQHDCPECDCVDGIQCPTCHGTGKVYPELEE